MRNFFHTFTYDNILTIDFSDEAVKEYAADRGHLGLRKYGDDKATYRSFEESLYADTRREALILLYVAFGYSRDKLLFLSANGFQWPELTPSEQQACDEMLTFIQLAVAKQSSCEGLDGSYMYVNCNDGKSLMLLPVTRNDEYSGVFHLSFKRAVFK